MTRRGFFGKATAVITAFIGVSLLRWKCRAGWRPINPIRLTSVDQIEVGMLFYAPTTDMTPGMWQIMCRMPSFFEHGGKQFDNYRMRIFTCKPLFKAKFPEWLCVERGEALFCFDGILETADFYRV